jgi:DnaJ-class molecular chaperone
MPIMTQPTNPGDEAVPGTPGTGEDVCRRCNGSGQIDGGECPVCGGTGKVVEGIGGG